MIVMKVKVYFFASVFFQLLNEFSVIYRLGSKFESVRPDPGHKNEYVFSTVEVRDPNYWVTDEV